jgi:hypothetical protein
MAQDDETLMRNSNTSSASTSALHARTDSTQKGKPSLTCSNCKRPGHAIGDCWSKGGGKEGQGPKFRCSKGKGKASANVATTLAPATATENEYAFTATTANAATPKNSLTPNQCVHLLDSGASCHFEPSRENFTTYCLIPPITVMSADGNNCQAIGKGEVPIKIKTDKGEITLHLLQVLHTPSMSQSLVSVSAMTRAKFAVHFEGRAAHVYLPTGDEIARIPKKDGLYHIKGQTTPTSSKPPKVASPAVMAVTPTQISMTKFHRRMGHANPQAL